MTKDMVRLGITLFLICGIAGLGLAAVYSQTKPIIDERAKSDVLAAAKAAIPGAQEITEETKDNVTYWLGRSGGEVVGAAVKIESKGYGQDPIELIVGVDSKGQVANVKIVSIKETPGIGSRVNDEAFLARFVGTTDPNKVDGISGATFSSKAVKGGVAKALELLGPIVAPQTTAPAVIDLAKIPDGTYSGTADGLMGPIQVSVKVASGKITDVTVVSSQETPTVAGDALTQIPKSIVKEQKVDVDTVSGATFASKGVIQAVRNALAGAQPK